MRRALWLVVLILLASPALAAVDRHVYLDLGNDNQVNDCPNPAHNTKGIAGNTSVLSYCDFTDSGAHDGKVICDEVSGCKSGTVTTATCTSPLNNGIVAIATYSTQLDVDGDGTRERVYRHPQACVWNMARSDSCEVHAGTYQRAGTMSDEDAAGAVDVVDRSDCWLATVAALGHGPSLPNDGLGYGTAAEPAYLRGANMRGSIDTWDANRNKTPDAAEGLSVYAAIFSGDADLDGNPKEATSCPLNNTVLGDAFYPLMWGCGSVTSGEEVCDSSLGAGETRPRVDTDGDGTFDTQLPGGPRDVSHFVVQDIEGTGYGGGPVSCSGNGVREKLGHFSIGGDGSSGGFVADRIYFHDNAYSNLCANEHYVAIFGDDENGGCAVDHEIRNSHLVLDNRFIINDDSDSWGGGDIESGCGWYFHDNRAEIRGNTGCVGQGCRKGLIRFKSVDSLQSGTRPKRFRIVNNEFVWGAATGDGTFPWFIHTECIGECGPFNPGWGEFWYVGNLFRFKAGSTGGDWAGFSCLSDGSPDSHAYQYLSFNNTWDFAQAAAETAKTLDTFCNQTGELIVQRNNAYYRATSVNTDAGDTVRRANNVCSQSAQTDCTTDATGRAGWWGGAAPLTSGTWDVGVNAGLLNYVPRSGGPLYEKSGVGACDPDGAGGAGWDIDWDGDQDTIWTDLAGNTVRCDAVNDALSIGAIQPNSDPGGGAFCGDGVKNGAESCDGSDLGGQSCLGLGFTGGGTLTCNGDCTFNTSGCSFSAAAATLTGATVSSGSVQ